MSKFSPSAAEVALVNQIFTQTDSQKIGVVTGEAAVKIFGGTKLPPSVLAEIWNLADEDNNGVLTRKGVAVAIRLLGHAQRGESVNESLIHKQGPPPSIEGLNAPVSKPFSPQNTGLRSTQSPPPGLPALTPQDKAKFLKLFIGCGPVGGLLSGTCFLRSLPAFPALYPVPALFGARAFGVDRDQLAVGDKARDVLVKSKLPVDKLSQIWNLSDTKNRGALDVTDFTVAMYLIQASMSGAMQVVPSVLPPFLYEQAKPDSVASHVTGESGSLSPTSLGGFNSRPISTIQPNYTGSSPIQPQMTGSALRPHATGEPPALPARTFGSTSSFAFSPQTTAPQWDVTAEEKANADRIFGDLDKGKRGVIEGDVAVPFLVQSGLSDDILAQVWDLSDIRKEGSLTRDGFAVAMHLIQGKLAGRDIPSVLPQSLIPPSMRSNGPSAHASAAPPQPAIPEAIRDLMWDDTPAPPATSPQQLGPSLGSTLRPQTTGTLSPQHTSAGAQKPNVFGGSDPFGNSAFRSPSGPPAAPVVHRDLLGDDDEPATSSPPLQDNSAEIGNAQNQLNSTNRSLDTTKAERVAVERQVTDQAGQLAALQTQLASAKAAYETETRLLASLRERFSSQSSDIAKAREELIHAESDLSALRVEKAELEGSVLRDKEEIRGLQRKMTETGMAVEALKADIEKSKKEAKQQKGLLAIARKQLATRETEKTKVEKELEETQAEEQSVTKEREEAEAQLAEEPAATPVIHANGFEIPKTASPDLIFAAGQPLPISPEMTGTISPAGSSKSTNPFERLALSGSPPPPSASPFLPFTNTSAVPTPSVPAEEPAEDPPTIAVPAPEVPSEEDPFGFSESFEDSQPTAKPRIEDLTSPRSVMSFADTDMFVTPPSSASLQKVPDDPAEAAASHFPALDAAASEIISPQLPGHFPTESKPHEDSGLDSQLKEIEQDDSDSDEDDDEPLTSVKAKLAEKVEPDITTTNGTNEAGPSTSSAFDDSFGISTLPSNATIRPGTPQRVAQPTSSPFQTGSPAVTAQSKDVFGSPFGASSQEVPAPSVDVTSKDALPATSPPADVTAFDEALGKVPSSSGAPSQFSQFTFDSAFDDNFDFAAASAATTGDQATPGPAVPNALNGTSAPSSAFPPVPSATTSARSGTEDSFDAVFLSSGGPSAPSGGPAAEATTAPAPVGQSQDSHPFSFDDAFSIPTRPKKQSSTNAPPITQPSTSTGSMGVSGISFDDAFGGVSASEALALDNAFTTPAVTPATAIPQSFQPPPGPPPGQFQAPSQAFPTTSPPTSPTRDSTSSIHRSISPQPRSMSPVPRLSSPKQRPGTANSTDKEKEKTKHSKLSIRLPFGRKKKSTGGGIGELPAVPSGLSASQVVEDPTPAAEDDIEAVKQLCQMGFSRGQAVTALEKYGYDVQRALNSLLGGA
ncbi:hypothetical protein EIP91_011294 [Steccherinum ochraceum]|uniref:Uncharacterized protein n=1 Tax=Steccherinum ochraceum TaxID=92696 RepID=A0A4R0RPY6_9APHY|nr:hypothetical protein EIP91_011294 [Steccherinum ochraceum]